MKKTSVFCGLLVRRGCCPRLLLAGVLVFIFSLCISCGLETYVYLEPVESVYNSGTNTATITLPEQSALEFRNYAIYYRIYLSNSGVFPVVEGQRGLVNTALNSHYNALYSYTTNDTISSVSLDTVFTEYNYYLLDVEGSERLSSLLTAGSEVELNFARSSEPYSRYPRVTINEDSPLNLRRNNGANIQPDTQPSDRYFFSSFSDANTANNANRDLQPQTGSGPTINAYVSMYILAVGLDSNYSPVYSRPTHIGIFILPTTL